MAARAIEDHFEYQHQFAARWNPQGEVDLSQGDGSSLMSSDAMVMGSDIASRAHADTSTLHAEHGGALHEGFERVQGIPGSELNFGISEDTASGHEYLQPDSGDTCLGNDRQRELLTFPEGEVDAVTISASDLECLQPERYLRSNIIDFYIKYLERKLSSEDRNRFYFFSSFFFTKLVGNSGTSTDIEECDVVYDQVRTWTGEVNLFEKDYIFIPIIRSSHWSLIIICHLSGLRTSLLDKRKVSPCIIHLDPIEGKHESFREQVRSYLYQACSERYQHSNKKDRILLAIACQMKYVRAKVPQQDNGYDCGLYILHYVETFLLESTSPNFSFASSNGVPHFTSPHFGEEISAKRVLIQNLINDLRNNLEGRAAKPINIQPKPQPKRLSELSPRPQPSKRLSKHVKGENKISKKWNKKETSVLLNRMAEIGRIRKGTEGPTHWELISQEIRAKLGTIRLEDECRRRYDTLLKAYKKVKKTGKSFCDITDAERREVNMATPLIEEWYKAIDTICLQRRSDNGKSRKRAKLSPEPQKPSRKLVVFSRSGRIHGGQAIPRFCTLDKELRSTLLNLIKVSLFETCSNYSYNNYCWELQKECQRLAIIQDQKPSDICRLIFQLSELKLVNFEYELWSCNGVPKLNLNGLRVYKKFVEKVLRKNPGFDIYLQIFNRYDSVSFPKSPLSSSLQRIRVLALYGCEDIEHADLSCFPELRTLSILSCRDLETVTGWEVLKKLGWLDILGCDSYLDFPPVQCLPSLREFKLKNFTLLALEMIWVPDFSQCVRLRRLEIWGFKSSSLSSMDLSMLRFLEDLTLGFCRALTTIQGLSGLHSLTKLDLEGCSALRRVPELGCLKALTHLHMSWSGVEEIPGVQELHLLTKLQLFNCGPLKTLPCLGHLTALTHLHISGSGVEEIPGVQDLVSLEELHCTRSRLKWLPDLHHLPRLREVWVGHTPLSTTDPSSFYYGKDYLHFNSKEDSVGFVDEISETSDTEYNHSDDDSY